MRRYIEIYSIMLRNSLIREMSFKANFLLWMIVEVLWFCGQIVFFSIIFGQVDRIGDWTKWEVVLLVGTHQMIAQLFQAFFFVNVANIPELVRTGKLDSLLVLPIDSQFAVSTKQFGLDSIVNAILGGVVVCVSLSQLGTVPTPTGDLAVRGRARIWRRRALFHYARPGRGKLLDRASAGPGIWLLQLPEHCALSGRDLPADFPHDFRLGHSGRDYREHSRQAAHQIAWTTNATNAASCHCLVHCFLAGARLLEICSAALLERQFVNGFVARLSRRNAPELPKNNGAKAEGEFFDRIRLRGPGNVLN